MMINSGKLLRFLLEDAAERLILEGKTSADQSLLVNELENWLDEAIESLLQDIDHHFYHNTHSIQEFVDKAESQTEKADAPNYEVSS